MQQLHDSMVIHVETDRGWMLLQKPVAPPFHKVPAIRLGPGETPIVTRMFL